MDPLTKAQRLKLLTEAAQATVPKSIVFDDDIRELWLQAVVLKDEAAVQRLYTLLGLEDYYDGETVD